MDDEAKRDQAKIQAACERGWDAMCGGLVGRHSALVETSRGYFNVIVQTQERNLADKDASWYAVCGHPHTSACACPERHATRNPR